MMAGVSGGKVNLEARAGMARGATRSRQAKPARRAIRNAFIVPVRVRDCAGSGSAPDEVKLFKESCKPKRVFQKDGIGLEFRVGKTFRITRHINNANIGVNFGYATSEFGTRNPGMTMSGKRTFNSPPIRCWAFRRLGTILTSEDFDPSRRRNFAHSMRQAS